MYYMATRKRKLPPSITAVLRKAIAESGHSFRHFEMQTGVKRQSLMKFMREEQSLRLDLADKVAQYLGLELTKQKER